MPASSFVVKRSFVQIVSGLMQHILPTMSTREAEDRWSNCQESLRMAASALPDMRMSDRSLLSKWSMILFVCWQTTVEGRIPELSSVEDPDGDTLRLSCHVPEEGSELWRLQCNASLHEEELGIAADDLGRLLSHVGEANFMLESNEILEAQKLLDEVAALLSRSCDKMSTDMRVSTDT